MDKPHNYEFDKLTNLKSIKEFCYSHLLDIVTGILKTENHSVKVRFIDPTKRNFEYTSLGLFFFVDDCMYIITTDKKYEAEHNPDILGFYEELEFLRNPDVFIIRVIFAGVYTGFRDDKGTRIFTGDAVSAKIVLNPSIPSTGGTNRARNSSNKLNESRCEAGVNEMSGIYAIILDNHSVPLSWATKLNVIGSLFYNLTMGTTEVSIQGLCNGFAQSQSDKEGVKKLLKKSPYFPPTTWQEKVRDLLCDED
ncbi:hypothetical protein EKL98_08665 [Flavobacterium bomense]|uniref:Uncharacterized protein n=1 Tax=Flavobacterium bomense TaxID=2497483 RepID=A0A432CMB6_9FLAO|nr:MULTISPECIES: hypothetical protein [Flavobacterium]RTZ02329.1 hypothetical protein EKM03_14290 [Flavobacterium sp. GSP6]RTZ04612.1 hypothetical protein EKL98_08665 [Flavobacterium bomense]